MYYPYLRGKQFELLALREFSAKFNNNTKIVPIIEPVKNQMNGMNIAVAAMLENSIRFAMILNPKDGDFKHVSDNDIIKNLPKLIESKGSWIPAYIYKNNGLKLLEHAERNGLSNLMVIFPSGADVSDEKVMSFLADKMVAYIVSGNLNINRSAKNRLLKLKKSVISLEDRFNDKPRNADYAIEPDEMFSEDFFYYRDDKLDGFSDFTPMVKDYIEGGMMPYAIAIHLTYQKSEDQIFVHHFVSDNNYDQSNIRGKFHEAAVKISSFYKAGGYIHTAAVDELINRSLSEENGYPGLGYIKKLSLMNHLELMNRILPE